MMAKSPMTFSFLVPCLAEPSKNIGTASGTASFVEREGLLAGILPKFD